MHQIKYMIDKRGLELGFPCFYIILDTYCNTIFISFVLHCAQQVYASLKK